MDDEENTELLDKSRSWIGTALTVPVFVLAMAQMIPAPAVQSWADSHTSRWLQFALTVFVSCGLAGRSSIVAGALSPPII